MVGIYDCFGYGRGYDVSFEERYRRIKSAGFDCVMLWWSDKFGRGKGYQEDARLALQAGLEIENIHAPVHEQNALSSDSLDGESVYQTYQQCVEDCAFFRINTMVIHLPNDNYPVNQLGLKRLEKIIHRAEDKGVQLAFENLENINNLDMVLNTFLSNYVGYCYDSCHHQNYAPNIDLLGRYGDRLMALHLHDNGGKRNQHQQPFDGNIDWSDVMEKIALTGYQGATTLEPMNWDYENLSMQEFLDFAFRKAKQLDEMRAVKRE